MKKYFKLFILMLLVFSYSYSGVMPETDWAKRKLKGKVRYDYSKKKENSIYKKLENKYEYYK